MERWDRSIVRLRAIRRRSTARFSGKQVFHATLSAPAAIGRARKPEVIGRTFESLASPQYRLLWFGMLLMMGGMNMQMVARGYLAWELTRSEVMVGLVTAGFAPPVLLFSIFGGAVADRVERKRIIQIGQLGTGILALFIAMAVVTNTVTIWHLVMTSVMQGVFFAFLMPARQSIIPSLVEKHQLSNAVALNASGMSLMTLVAPAIAGFIYAGGGPEAAFFTIAGLNFGAMLLTTTLKPTRVVGAGKSKRMWKDVVEGVKYVRHNRTVMLLLLLALSTTVLAMPIRNLLPVQVDKVFHREVEAFSLLLTMIGLGALVGSLLIAGLKKSQHRGTVLLLTTVVSGVAIVLAGLNQSYFIALFIMVLIGLGEAGRRSLNAALIMEEADEEHRGRVMGVYMMSFGMMPLGTLPIAALGGLIGIGWAFAISGALLVAVALPLIFMTKRIRAL